MGFSALQHLSNDELTKQLHQLAGDLRTTECQLILHLIEAKARKVYALAGYSSLFSYCMGELKFSEGTSCRRLAAARVVERYPEALAYVTDGRLHVTALAALEKQLTPDNHSVVFAKAVGLTKRQLEWLIAGLAPQQDVPSSIRKCPASAGSERPPMQPPTLPLTASETGPSSSPATPANPPRPATTCAPAISKPVSALVPLSPERLLVKFTADREMEANILRARELLAHRLPKGDLAEVFAAALDALLEDLDPARKLARKEARLTRKAAKKAQAKSHSAAVPAADAAPDAAKAEISEARDAGNAALTGTLLSRYIPAEVRLAVWEEAGGRCTYESPDGKRCDETRWLQVDHCEPWALGGKSTHENCRIYCPTHNRYAAQQTFGAHEPWRPRSAEATSR